MSWTDERVELLKTMWGEGKSASQIAKALGGVTRNAVIGKVHRLGLSNRSAGAAPKPAAKEAPAEPAAAPAAAEPAPAPEPQPEPRAAEPEPAPAARAEPEPQPAPERPAMRQPGPPTGPQPPQPSEVSEEARRNLEAVEKKAKKLDLLHLTERTCKWPIGDPATEDFYFCGLPSTPGKPYCEAHVSVAFQPMSSRRDRSRSR
ncbi:MAG: GcrA family cell cycle regulator [Pseudomonadota bacterium]